MPSLADGHIPVDEKARVLEFPDPPAEFSSGLQHLSTMAQKFIYYGLSPRTRNTYESYQRSYEHFCYSRVTPPYPATAESLIEWITLRAFGAPRQGPLKANSISQALSAVRSKHIDRDLSTSAFDSPLLARLKTGIAGLQGKQDTKKAKPLSLGIIEQMTSPAPDDHGSATLSPLASAEVDELNFDTAAKIAFAGFLRTAEFTYEQKEVNNSAMFQATKLQRRDITFAENDEHAIIYLRSSKSDYDHSGVEIVVARTGTASCPVLALRSLFDLDPQHPTAPLLRSSKGAFNRKFLLSTLKNRLRRQGYHDYKDYTGHSFRRGAAQQASDFGMLEEEIQRLGRWSSDAFKGYFSYSYARKFLLNRRFLTGRTLPITQSALDVD